MNGTIMNKISETIYTHEDKFVNHFFKNDYEVTHVSKTPDNKLFVVLDATIAREITIESYNEWESKL